PRIVDLCSREPGALPPAEAVELTGALGGLAPWWLCKEVLRLAAAEEPLFAPLTEWKPQLPSVPGSCWIVYANEDTAALPLLRYAFLLPLRWVPGVPHSPQLPSRLAELAQRVARSLGCSGWGLQLSAQDRINDLDLVAVDFDSESGWAA